MIDENKFIEYIRSNGTKIFEEGEEVSIDGVLERYFSQWDTRTEVDEALKKIGL